MSDAGARCRRTRGWCTLLSMSRGPPRKVCQAGVQEPTVGAEGGQLPNFLEEVGQKSWAENMGRAQSWAEGPDWYAPGASADFKIYGG